MGLSNSRRLSRTTRVLELLKAFRWLFRATGKQGSAAKARMTAVAARPLEWPQSIYEFNVRPLRFELLSSQNLHKNLCRKDINCL